MKKYLLLLLLLSASTLTAQNKFNAGASFNIGFPSNSLVDLTETGIGGSVIGEYVFSENVSVMLSASYQNFPGISEGIAVQGKVINFSVNSIPILAGVRYYFSPEFFGLVDAGVNFLRATADIYQVYTEEKISSDYKARFAGEVGAGYCYKLADPSVFEISGAYQIVKDSYNSFSLKLGILILLDNI